MAPRDTEICCCGASKWTSVIAGFQIGGAIFMVIAYFVMSNKIASVEHGRAGAELNDSNNSLFAIGFLFVAVINIFVGIMLQIGNKQGLTCLLWTWVTIAVIGIFLDIGAVVYLIGHGVTPGQVLSSVGGGFFRIFAICVVSQRIKDVKMNLAALGDLGLSETKEPTV